MKKFKFILFLFCLIFSIVVARIGTNVFLCPHYFAGAENLELNQIKSNQTETNQISLSGFERQQILSDKNLNTNTQKTFEYTFFYNGKNYHFKDSDFKLNLTKKQKENYHNISTLKALKNMNFSEEEALTYVFPETKEILKRLSKNFEQAETEDEVLVVENKCKLEYFSGKNGKCINRLKFFGDIYKSVQNGENKIKRDIEILDYRIKESAKKLFCEKSCFSTNFSSSSQERKNNIRVALKAFDGLVIEEGEIFSFNEITGERTEEKGYSKAKIISKGTFVLGLGGGVCQVSTTLYNACILSNLEIVESTSHSLPVSYVEPSFDAMVSFGSSDLKVRNNSGGKIIITTSSENDVCKIKIFGLKNKYKITRQSEKISIISAEPEIVETDYLKYGDYNLEIGEEKRLSYSKDGFISRGYLNFYDEKGNLVERKQIRENRYNATKGIVIRREK